MHGTTSYYSNSVKRPVLNIRDEDRFFIDETFVGEFKDRQPEFGPVGLFTFKRTYARPIADENTQTEEFWQTLQRIVNGIYTIQKWHCRHHNLPWSDAKAQRSAQIMFRLMWDFKFLPGGRGLWMMGTDYVEKHGSAALNNCAFVSTNEIDLAFAEPFCYLMDFSMLGVGVGSDCRGAGKVVIQRPIQGDDVHVVADTREGWVDLLFRTLEAFVGNGTLPKKVDYSKVRPYGSKINGFGGTASGPDPLIQLISEVQRILEPLIDKPITSEAIVDLCDLVGVCVVAGNVRRTAIIMFGEGDDDAFLNLKNPELNSAAMKTHRWASNNSILADVGMDYTKTAAISAKAGEPGYMWLDNARKYGRMGELCDDSRVLGFNPCAEVSLESYELCVSGQTMIQFDGGVAPIEHLLGKDIKVWNGDSWSTVRPRETGRNRDLYRVTLSDGSHLDCTANHGWHVKPEGKRVYRRVEAKDLRRGDKVVEFEIDAPISGQHEPNAFEWGLFAGDGYVDTHNDTPMVSICGDKAKLRDLDVNGVWYKPQDKEGYADPYNRLCLRGLITMQDATAINDKSIGLPERVFNMDRSSALEFLSGWIEADGTITNKGSNAEGYRIYGAEPKMRDLQLLLRRVGVDHSTIRLFAEAGETTNFGERNYALWYCQIPSYECAEIPTRLKQATNFGDRTAVNNAHPDGAQIDRARKQKIVSVEKLPGRHTTYCFDEPENHMAVFGNVLTYQCNLVELFPSRHSSYEEFERTIKYAYLYAKTVSLIPTHNPRTNSVMLRNRRIGLSQSGIVQSFKRHGRRKHFNWCDQGYAYVTKLDRIYSEWLCVRKSIKKTTVKPAGCRPLSAYVTTDQGIFTLAEIMANHPIDQDWDEVDGLTASGIGKPLTKSLRRGQSEVYEICLRNGRKLTSTPNHPWGVEQTEGQTVFTRTDQIVVGSRIMCRPGTYSSTSEAELTVVSGHGFHPNANTDITQPEQMTEDLGWIIGALYGNGSFSTSKHRVRFVHGDLPIIEHYKVLMMKTFGLDIPIHEDSRGGRYYCDVGNKLLFQWFEANGLRKTKSKRLVGVPVAIRRSSQNSILAFIAGYADTDGCFSRGSFCVDSASEAMMRSLQVVAEAVGISMSVMHNTKGENFQAKKSIWKAHASRVHTLEFARERINALSMKARRSPIDEPKRLNGNRHPHEVVSVRRLSKPVYTGDVEVADDHVFYEGGMLSHNTTSLLPGVTPGIHFEHAEYYFRTVRVAAINPLVEEYRKAGYRVEQDSYDQSGRTSVIYFPVKAKLFERGKSDVSIWEQMENAAKLQKYWSDNSVSVTVTFRKHEADDIQRCLELYENRLKTVSFLPLSDHGYEQAPYITITKEEYEAASALLGVASFNGIGHDIEATPRFCSNDSCTVPVRQSTEERALP